MHRPACLACSVADLRVADSPSPVSLTTTWDKAEWHADGSAARLMKLYETER